MLTIREEIKKGEVKSDGTYNIKIRFTLDRKLRRLSTSLFATSKDLTKSLKLKEGTPIKREVDKLIRTYQDICAKLQLEVNAYTLDDVFDYLEAERERTRSIDFIQFCKEWLEATDIKGKKNYKCAVNALIAYIGNEHLDVTKLTATFLRGFTEYLSERRMERIKVISEAGGRITSNRAVSLYLGSIRHLFNEAKRRYNDYDRNIILITNSPFENFVVPKQEATRKRAIPANLIKIISELPYRYTVRGEEANCCYNLAKDCFMLSFCLIGMNSADLYNAAIKVGNTIIYNRTKTRARRSDEAQMQIEIPSLILPLIEKYRDCTGQRVFNFYRSYTTASSFNRAVNYGLKEIGKLIGIADLEYYAARHSWATIALNKVGIDKYTVHAALNHIDESMKVTDIYIERDFVNENRANAKVVKYVFGK